MIKIGVSFLRALDDYSPLLGLDVNFDFLLNRKIENCFKSKIICISHKYLHGKIRIQFHQYCISQY